jgi:opacity protein-like surface antigen
MGNLWYDVPLSDTITPYVGGGAGVAFIDGETRYSGGNKPYGSSETGFAFQLGAGLRLAVLDNVTLDLGYRLRGVDGVEFGNSDFAASSTYDADTIISHNFVGGVSIGFPPGPRAAIAHLTPPAEEPFYYVSLFGGASFSQDIDTTQNYDTRADYDYSLELKSGYILGGAIGTRLGDGLRAEAELSYARWNADHTEAQGDNHYDFDARGHVSATYLLGNVWYDVHNDTSFTPYLGGGVGAAWVEADTIFNHDDSFGYSEGEMAFAFQLGGGVKFDVTDNIAFDLGYRFKGILDVDFDARGEAQGIVPYEGGDLYSHNVQGGVILSF